ncbi:MAG: hypothetical protein K2F57_04445 [Candidatus Gastranaerophilales bacterium]|nr:hypothetical protein [Candidatus Gastranaerophilales bacterium]
MAGDNMNVNTNFAAGLNNVINGFSTGEQGTKVSFKDILRKTPIFNLDPNLQAQAGSSSATASTGIFN